PVVDQKIAKLTSAEHAWHTATPASTVRTGGSWPRAAASSRVRTSAPTAPTNAATGRSTVIPRTRTPTAPRAAPEETPRRYGSASGLRTTACITVPATASPAPTAAAATTRAPRPCHTIASWTGVNGSPGQVTAPGARAVHTWCHAEPHTWPTVIDA